MRTTVSCSWCHAGVGLMPGGGPTYCPDCGHRADVCRLDCDCPQCRRQGERWDRFLAGEDPNALP